MIFFLASVGALALLLTLALGALVLVLRNPDLDDLEAARRPLRREP